MLHKFFLSIVLCLNFVFATTIHSKAAALSSIKIDTRYIIKETNIYATAPKPNSTIDIDNNTIFGLNIYPNPVNQTMHIQFSSPIQATGLLSLYDITGRAIYTHTIYAAEQQHVIDAANYPTGVYICMLSLGQSTYTQKITISH